MGTFRSLSARMRKAAAKVNSLGSERAKEIGENFLTDVVYETPVDTSTARSNWQIGIDRPIPDGAEIEAYAFGSFGSTAAASSQAAVAVGKARIDTKKPGETLYISNVLDYIIRLNQGYSRQARPYYVQQSLFRARNIASKVRLFR